MPKKAFYRARAHVNPLSHNNAFNYPRAPRYVPTGSLGSAVAPAESTSTWTAFIVSPMFPRVFVPPSASFLYCPDSPLHALDPTGLHAPRRFNSTFFFFFYSIALPHPSSEVDWSAYFSGPDAALAPTVVDVGCGFGGLTVALAKLLPEERSLGARLSMGQDTQPPPALPNGGGESGRGGGVSLGLRSIEGAAFRGQLWAH